MVHHEHEGKQSNTLRGGGENAKSFTKGPGRFNPEHGAANVPKGEAKMILIWGIGFTKAPEDAWEFGLLMHTVGGGPATN